MSLENDLKALDDVTKKEELAEDWKRQKQSGVREIQKKVQARVRAGERTGDPLVDVVLAALGEPNGELFERLRAIDKLFRMSVGEYAYLVIGEQKQFRFHCFGGGDSDSDYRWVEHRFIGLIEEGGVAITIDDKQADVSFPIRKWMHFEPFSSGEVHGVSEKEDPIKSNRGFVAPKLLDKVILGTLTDDEFKWHISSGGHTEYALELYIGNTAVEEVLATVHNGMWHWYQAAFRLGHPIPLTPEIERMRGIAAASALELLDDKLAIYGNWFARKSTLKLPTLEGLLKSLRRLDADAVMLGISDDPRITKAQSAIPEVVKGIQLLGAPQ